MLHQDKVMQKIQQYWPDEDPQTVLDTLNAYGDSEMERGRGRVHRAPIANGGGGPEKSRTVARYAGNPDWEFGIRCAGDPLPGE